MAYKQVILVRKDLGLGPGKACAQAAHASVEAVFKAGWDSDIVKTWRKQGMAKIVLKVANEKELIKFFQIAKDDGITASLITDAGHTVVAPGTKTCVGIGPATDEEIDRVTGELSIL